MRAHAALTVLLFTLIAWGPQCRAARPCELQRAASIDVLTAPNGQLLVPVTMEGHPGLMALQLNSGLPYLFPGAIDYLGLKDRLQRTDWDAEIRGRKVTQQVKVKSTMLGEANFAGWDFTVYPADSPFPPTYAGMPVFGVMTSIFMNAVDLELNLAQGKVNLFKPNKCGQAPVYWGGEFTEVPMFTDPAGLIVFPLELEGKRFETSLNTGSRLSVISSEAAKRFLGFDESSPEIEHETLSGDNEIASFRAMSLTAKGLDVRNARVRIYKMTRCQPGTSGRDSRAIGCQKVFGVAPFSIGTDLMRRLRIYVSAIDGKVYFSRAAPAAGNAAGAANAGAGGAASAADAPDAAAGAAAPGPAPAQ